MTVALHRRPRRPSTIVARAVLAIGLAATVASCGGTDPDPSADGPPGEADAGTAAADDDLCAAWLATTAPPPTDESNGEATIDELIVQGEALREAVPDELAGEVDTFLGRARELADLGDQVGWTGEGFEAAPLD